ncbi:MAG TPA: hypothetical protein VGH73_21505 [Thermoanaerobaculia bacterium]|jgi:hypothetical protein
MKKLLRLAIPLALLVFAAFSGTAKATNPDPCGCGLFYQMCLAGCGPGNFPCRAQCAEDYKFCTATCPG